MRQLRAKILKFMKKNLFYATIIQFMQKQNAISENQKHSIENTLKGAYQLKKKSPLRVFTTHGQLNKEMEI